MKKNMKILAAVMAVLLVCSLCLTGCGRQVSALEAKRKAVHSSVITAGKSSRSVCTNPECRDWDCDDVICDNGICTNPNCKDLDCDDIKCDAGICTNPYCYELDCDDAFCNDDDRFDVFD